MGDAGKRAIGAKFNDDAFQMLKAKKPKRRRTSKRGNANGRGGVKIERENGGNSTATPNRETASTENGAIAQSLTTPLFRCSKQENERERRRRPSKRGNANGRGGVKIERENGGNATATPNRETANVEKTNN